MTQDDRRCIKEEVEQVRYIIYLFIYFSSTYCGCLSGELPTYRPA